MRCEMKVRRSEELFDDGRSLVRSQACLWALTDTDKSWTLSLKTKNTSRHFTHFHPKLPSCTTLYIVTVLKYYENNMAVGAM